MRFQKVHPHTYKASMAEHTIQTFKIHFKTGLQLSHPNFPPSNWDLLLKQATMTLKMLRSARFNPQLSVHADIFGQFDYSSIPLLPPGL